MERKPSWPLDGAAQSKTKSGWRQDGKERNGVSETEKEIFCCGHDDDVGSLKTAEFGRVTVKNELLIQLGLENMGFPSNTEVPVELESVNPEGSQLACCISPERLAASSRSSI